MRAVLLATAESRRFAACLALSLGVHAGGFLAAAQWRTQPVARAASPLIVTLNQDNAAAMPVVVAEPLAVAAAAAAAEPVRTDAPAAKGRQPAETPPEPLVHVTPEFPEGALAQGIVSGRVELEAWIDENGKVDSVRIVASSVSDVFNASARAAIRATQFKPATAGGIPVRSVIRPVIVYDLGEQTAGR